MLFEPGLGGGDCGGFFGHLGMLPRGSVTFDFLFYCVKKLVFTSATYWVFARLRVTECSFASPCFFASAFFLQDFHFHFHSFSFHVFALVLTIAILIFCESAKLPLRSQPAACSLDCRWGGRWSFATTLTAFGRAKVKQVLAKTGSFAGQKPECRRWDGGTIGATPRETFRRDAGSAHELRLRFPWRLALALPYRAIDSDFSSLKGQFL